MYLAPWPIGSWKPPVMINLLCPLEGSSSEGSHCKTYLPYIFLKTQCFSLMRSFLLFCQHVFKIEHTVTFVCRKSSQFWGLSLWLTSEKFFNKVMIFLWNKDIKKMWSQQGEFTHHYLRCRQFSFLMHLIFQCIVSVQ